MRTSLLLLTFIAGCTPEPTSTSPGGPPPGAPAPTPPLGTDATAPPGGGEAARPAADPTSDLSALIAGGPKVKLSIRLEGSKTAQVSVLSAGASRSAPPKVEAILNVTDGAATLDAPATLDHPLYLTAVADLKGDGPSKDDLGGASEPLTLAGQDVVATIKLSTDQAWIKKMPWDLPPPQADGQPAGPPPGSAPEGPPPGSAPEGAPAGPAPEAAPASTPPPAAGSAAPG